MASAIDRCEPNELYRELDTVAGKYKLHFYLLGLTALHPPSCP